MTEFLPGFFLGDFQNATDPAFLYRNNIRKVVNCSKDLPFYSEKTQNYRIAINDTDSKQDNDVLFMNFKPVLEFIFSGEPVSRYNATLIHCRAGISRSSSLCVAILRTCGFKTIVDAINFLIQKRPQVFFQGRIFNFKRALYDYFGH